MTTIKSLQRELDELKNKQQIELAEMQHKLEQQLRIDNYINDQQSADPVDDPIDNKSTITFDHQTSNLGSLNTSDVTISVSMPGSFPSNIITYDADHYDTLCKETVLTEAFIIEHKFQVNWPYIWQYQTLSDEFLIKHINKSNIDLACRYQTLPDCIMQKYKNIINWSVASRYQILSNNVLINCCYFIDWRVASQYQKLSDNILIKCRDEIYWSVASQYQTLSDDVLSENLELVDWYKVCQYQTLSAEITKKFARYIINEAIEKNENFVDGVWKAT